MELKVDSERVREAAFECSDADKILRKLFPEAFLGNLVSFTSLDHGLGTHLVNNDVICIRSSGEYRGKGIYLSDTYKWEIVRDNEGFLVLIGRQK